MSRSGYSDDGDFDQWEHIKWRGQVASAFRGRRGQDFFRDLLKALDDMPEKRLIAEELQQPDGAVCTIGALGAARGVEMEKLHVEDYEGIAAAFGVARQVVQEVEWMNDEGSYYTESPESRWCRMRAWVSAQIKQDPTP